MHVSGLFSFEAFQTFLGKLIFFPPLRVDARARDHTEVNIFLIATFASIRGIRGGVRPGLVGTLNSRAASLNPRLKELNPTNTSSEPPSTAVVAVPESRFISARISKFFSSPPGTRGPPTPFT